MDKHSTSRTRPTITVTDPRIIAAVEEGIILAKAVSAAEDAVAALDGASTDLAIAMWDRMRRLNLDATKARAVAFAEIQRARQEGVAIIPEDLDAAIESLGTTSWVVHSIGRYQGNAAVAASFELARTSERTPTRVMAAALRELKAYHDTLLAELGRRIAVEVDRHYDRGGEPLPDGRPFVKLGNPATMPSIISFGH